MIQKTNHTKNKLSKGIVWRKDKPRTTAFFAVAVMAILASSAVINVQQAEAFSLRGNIVDPVRDFVDDTVDSIKDTAGDVKSKIKDLMGSIRVLFANIVGKIQDAMPFPPPITPDMK